MLLYNPTPYSICAKYDGSPFLFRPYEKRDIFNVYAAKTMLSRWNKYGLVDISYDDKTAADYPVHELFVHRKAIEGVKKLVETLEKRSYGFQIFEDECGDKVTAERHLMKKKHEKVLEEIKVVNKLLAELSSTSEADLKTAEAAKLKKMAEKLISEAKTLEGNADGKDSSNNQKSVKG